MSERNDPQQRLTGLLVREGYNLAEIEAALQVGHDRAQFLWYRAQMNYRNREKPENRNYSPKKRAYDRLYRKMERLAGSAKKVR